MSLRGVSGARDVAIHCMQWSRTERAVRLPAHSGSPRAFALAMTRWGARRFVHFGSNTILVIARSERSERRGNPLHAMVAYGESGSAPGSQWIATGLRPRDDKVGSEAVNGSVPTRSLSLRGVSEARDAAIHCMQWSRTESAVRLPGSQWIATGLRPRDDKVGSEAVDGSVPTRSLSLRGESEARDAAIHCMQWSRTESAVRLPDSQWIATGFRPRDDKAW